MIATQDPSIFWLKAIFACLWSFLGVLGGFRANYDSQIAHNKFMHGVADTDKCGFDLRANRLGGRPRQFKSLGKRNDSFHLRAYDMAQSADLGRTSFFGC